MEAGGALRETCCWEVQARTKGRSSLTGFPALCLSVCQGGTLHFKSSAGSEMLMKTSRTENSGSLK